MARDQYGVANSFLNSFMQGYSFIDNIQANKRREARLEEELRLRRERQARMDALVEERARFTREDRARVANQRERANAARAIMAAPGGPNLDELREYTDVPGVTEFIRNEQQRQLERGQLTTAMQGDPSFSGAVQQAATGGAQPADPNDPTQLGTTSVSGADPTMGITPSAPAPGAMRPDLVNRSYTADQINEMVQNREITEQEAQRLHQVRRDDALVQPIDAAERAIRSRRRDERRAEQEVAGQIVAEAERIAGAFVDMGDEDGQVYRDWTPTQATQWYHANRNNISDPTLREQTDRLMEDRIASSLDASRTIMLDPNVDIDSNEYRNAQRQFARGLGLAQDMAIDREPTELAGNDGRGVSRRNDAMINNTIQAAGQGRPAPLPGNPNRHRADIAVANRGNSGVRVSDAYANAAYGLLSRGIIDINIYGAMIKTGAPLGDLLAAQGIEQRFVQGDPTKDTFIETVNADGTVTRQLAIPARRVPSLDSMQEQYRNTFSNDIINHLYRNVAPSFATEDDPERGRRTIGTFLADMSANEATARANGYSLQNINDVSLLYQRWSDFHVLRDVYNRELSGGWFSKPTFTQQYGSIDSRIFDRNFEQEMQGIIEEEELETRGGNPLRLTPLKEIGGAEIQYLRQQFPAETQNMSDQQIAEIVRDQERQLGR